MYTRGTPHDCAHRKLAKQASSLATTAIVSEVINPAALSSTSLNPASLVSKELLSVQRPSHCRKSARNTLLTRDAETVADGRLIQDAAGPSLTTHRRTCAVKQQRVTRH